MKLNKIYQGDCLEVMKSIPDKSKEELKLRIKKTIFNEI